jgi:hypothetical protein
MVNDGHSAVPGESGVYIDQRVHSSPPLIIIPDANGYQCCVPKEEELLAPSPSLNLAMPAQFILILTATALSMYDYFYPRS